MKTLSRSRHPNLQPGDEPLRKRAPATDEDGRPLSDFMMLFPGLRERPKKQLETTLTAIQGVLAHFERDVVFAEMNLRLNVLWVSIRPKQGLRLEISAAIQHLVPSAKLVSHV